MLCMPLPFCFHPLFGGFEDHSEEPEGAVGPCCAPFHGTVCRRRPESAAAAAKRPRLGRSAASLVPSHLCRSTAERARSSRPGTRMPRLRTTTGGAPREGRCMRVVVADKMARHGPAGVLCQRFPHHSSDSVSTTAPCVQGHGSGVHLQPDDRPPGARQRGTHRWAGYSPNWVLPPAPLLAWPPTDCACPFSPWRAWLAHVHA